MRTIISFGPDPANPAIAGGAYLVLMKKVFPQNCRTDKEAAEAFEFLERVDTWRLSQEQEINEAYAWAIGHMRAEINEHLNQARKFAASKTAFVGIPKPPFWME